MKVVNTILKVLAALAAVAGVVYVIATYGDKIVAWAKKTLHCGDCCCEDEFCACDEDPDTACPQEAEEAEKAPTAEETDFEG